MKTLAQVKELAQSRVRKVVGSMSEEDKQRASEGFGAACQALVASAVMAMVAQIGPEAFGARASVVGAVGAGVMAIGTVLLTMALVQKNEGVEALKRLITGLVVPVGIGMVVARMVEAAPSAGNEATGLIGGLYLALSTYGNFSQEKARLEEVIKKQAELLNEAYDALDSEAELPTEPLSNQMALSKDEQAIVDLATLGEELDEAAKRQILSVGLGGAPQQRRIM